LELASQLLYGGFMSRKSAVSILEKILEVQNAMHAEMSGMRGEMSGMRGEMSAMRNEMHEGFHMLGRRIDNLLLGAHASDHHELRERVERLERHAGLR
jgi:hypothetical protein